MQRWRILQAALPQGITIVKSIALVNALAKLHNFCIDEVNEVEAGIADVLPIDDVATRTSRGAYVMLHAVENADRPIPTELLGGGEHFHDIPPLQRRPRNSSEYEIALPRYRLLQQVIESHMVRPHANVHTNN